ncbi:MAG: methyltransferase domain-containing protein [Nocardiopsaceae bacterium]|nr:methyltransferase domain-containing protein [Nocardiopsaceae bacterium]
MATSNSPASADGAERTARLADQLAAHGHLAPEWRAAFTAVHRHAFIPDTIYDEHNQPLNRATEPDRWMDAAYANAPVVTQFNDGAGVLGDLDTQVTSSSVSMPAIVATMLTHLDLQPGQRVLEIGTGAGYNTALLCARTGDHHVTTIEVDPGLADAAAKRLADAGWHPDVHAGDGAAGWPQQAPYDRVIATCAVREIPDAWITQTRPGGIIVTPWGNTFSNGVLLKLHANHDPADPGRHVATGRVVDGASFMWLRSQRTPRPDPTRYATGDPRTSATGLHPDVMSYNTHADFAIGLAVPDVYALYKDDDTGDAFTAWFCDQNSDPSAAAVRVEPGGLGAAAHRVRQWGPRNLWDEIEQAYGRWRAWGCPARERFGVTISLGHQPGRDVLVWLDHPGNPIG